MLNGNYKSNVTLTQSEVKKGLPVMMLSPVFSIQRYDSTCLLQSFQDEDAVNLSNFFAVEAMKGLDHVTSNDQPWTPEFAMKNEGGSYWDCEANLLSERLKAIEADLEKSLVSKTSATKKASPITISALEVLSNYTTSRDGFEVGEETNLINKESHPLGGRELSTEEIVRIAAARFIHMSDHKDSGDSSVFMHPFGLTFADLGPDETKNIELASLLLAAAEKVSNKKYEQASDLLAECYQLSSNTGKPVERVAYYFTVALQERIDRETGGVPSKRTRDWDSPGEEVVKAILGNSPKKLALHKMLPFSQLMQFTAMQTIIENVGSSKRVHMIDLSITHGLQWTILMQALAARTSCRIDCLKITAVGVSLEAINETGQRLASFAEALGLPFRFKAVIVADMADLEKGMLEVKKGEKVGIYSAFFINTMIGRPDCLENLVSVLRALRPCIMIVMDVEAKHNSPSFIHRFAETLFYHSALFDCIDSCIDKNDSSRRFIEECFCSPGIKSLISAEGCDRVLRHVGISVWRSFFPRFGFVEAELSEWSSYQARLLVKQFRGGSACSLVKNGKSFMIDWKGSSLYFISAWKYR